MGDGRSKAALLKEMTRYFPDRWEVTDIESRRRGDVCFGAVKIHCSEDDKLFLSDFSARLDGKGKVVELTLDGVEVGKYVGKLHSS